MYNIDYDILLNEQGRPYIHLPDDYEQRPEDRFFVVELTRYILQSVYNAKSVEFDKNAAKVIESGISLLGQVSDEIAEILWNQMKVMGDVDLLLAKRYHITLNTVEEMNMLDDKYIHHNNKIYTRQEGLRVFIIENNSIYELTGGITNDCWTKIE